MEEELIGKVDKEGNIYTICVNEYGSKFWYKDSKYHRDDGPAVIYSNGDK